MREFTIDLTKSLARGQVPFPGNELVLLTLHECFNQIPTETGLTDYQPLRATGWGDGFFHYITILDQNEVPWYWYPVFDGHVLSGNSVPSEPTTGLDAVSLLDEPISWIQILDENDLPWKLYPDSSTGETRATDTTELSGTGLLDLVWKGTTTEWWTIRFNSVDKTRYAVKL